MVFRKELMRMMGFGDFIDIVQERKAASVYLRYLYIKRIFTQYVNNENRYCARDFIEDL